MIREIKRAFKVGDKIRYLNKTGYHFVMELTVTKSCGKYVSGIATKLEGQSGYRLNEECGTFGAKYFELIPELTVQ